MFADYHIHTQYSDDSTQPIEEVVRRAIALGLDEICFTDHVDYGVKCDKEDLLTLSREQAACIRPVLNIDYAAYFEHIDRLRQKHGDKITIRRGFEFGMQVHTLPRFQKLFDAYPPDFVLLACHQVDDKEFWTEKFQQGKTPDDYNRLYYEEILACMRHYKNYSVLAHLDMIQRHNEPRHPFEKSRDIVEEILRLAIADGKGIEVNTSSFYYGLPDLTPERRILELYHALGGRIITVGSDCHSADRLGEHIPRIYGTLRGIGFTHICTFSAMRPIFHALPE